MNGYKLDLANKTITITKAFEEAVASGKGKEYELFMKIQKDIPGLTVIHKTHKTPKKYKTKGGEEYSCNQFKNLTYERMEAFMNAIPNSEEYLKAYNFLRYGVGSVQTSCYTAVRRWFVAQFPEYRKNPLFYLNNEPKVIDFIPFLAEVQKKDA